ncbi:hypothetical protein BDZ90DRAFT_261904 [Jaminaea rosea]|uniref:PLAC8-domain-containing protein n=1 Tax=Jaminaea rosea TaxID=1569628 RepID=A0A316ULL7_9BASI|nr:hypothetical protein BDZ90DRAFT_261904 [Jaminaea rosea]PWN25698.1 hypothetical protein BDZ90DRAFT_261904 [Jaminaea rosea]
MADVGADLGGACCAIFNFSWFYNSRIGTDITCLDKCCRCHCCDDKGALPEDEQPGRKKRQEEAARKAAAARGEEEGPPAYEAQQPGRTEAMQVPVGAAQVDVDGTPASGQGTTGTTTTTTTTGNVQA